MGLALSFLRRISEPIRIQIWLLLRLTLMHAQHLKEMVRALRSALKEPAKAQAILERYWQDRKAIIWEIKDVHRAANERGMVFTNNQARQILQKFMDSYSKYDPELGINWLRLLEIIDESCLGRKMTHQELKRFLEKDVIATQK